MSWNQDCLIQPPPGQNESIAQYSQPGAKVYRYRCIEGPDILLLRQAFLFFQDLRILPPRVQYGQQDHLF